MKILGTGSAIPRRSVTNEELSQFLDTSDEWIVTRTGIHTRHVLTDERLEDLAAAAARAALDSAQVDAKALDYILCSHVMGPYITPGMSCIVGKAVGASCAAVDLNAACAGFLYALDMAEAYIASGRAKYILIVCAEAITQMVDWRDRATCVLFGDGAGAVVVGAGDSLRSMRLGARSNTEALYARQMPGNSPFVTQPIPAGALVMNGQEVYKFAVSTSTRDLKGVISQAGLEVDQVDLYLLHQANMRIIEAVRERLKQPKSKFPTNIERTGNVSSACIPILLDELVRGPGIMEGTVLALSAFGAGLVHGACVLRWEA